MESSNNSNRRARALAPLAIIVVAVVIALALVVVGVFSRQEASPPTSTEEANVKTVIMPIEGMSCSACTARVKKTLTAIAGVSDVEVNLAERNARVRFDPSKLSPDRMVSAVNGLGYHASAPEEAN
jgi:copper chaperone CopZ